MLSTLEIVELERKVAHYRLKKLKPIVYLSCIVLIISASLVLFIHPTFSKQAVSTNISTSLTSKDEITEPVKQLVKAEEEKKVPQKDENETLVLQLPVIGANDKASRTSVSTKNIQEEELETKILMRKPPSSMSTSEEPLIRPKDFDTALLPPPGLDETKPKGMIKIETKEMNSIEYLKEKYEKTHSIVYALMLSEEYYLTKNYQESNKWAIISNNLDADNEKSWILFAKTKVKLGRKDDAITALKAYVKNNKSQAAQALLNQLIIGEPID